MRNGPPDRPLTCRRHRTTAARAGRHPPLTPGDTKLPNATSRIRLREGLPTPRGATWTGTGVNFAVFSANATRMELCLFDETGERELDRVDLPEYTNEVFHGFLPDARPGQTYGYRAHGPYEPTTDLA